MARIDELTHRESLFSIISEYGHLEKIDETLFITPRNSAMAMMFDDSKIQRKISAREFCFLRELNVREIWKELYGNKPYEGIRQDKYLIGLWERYYESILRGEL